MDKSGYTDKPGSYFSGIRRDFISLLPKNSEAIILELGCGAGGTGRLALQEGKCGRYIGIDISEKAADLARESLSEVIVGDVEEISLPWREPTFDVLILSEVLEHLRDPWDVLGRLVPLLKPGGLVLASSPNISHYKMIAALIRGKWDLAESGVMDATHLRWFTPESFERMFREAGVIVDSVEPVTPMGRFVRMINRVLGGRLRHLFMTQICLRGHQR